MKTIKIINIGNFAIVLVAFLCTLILPGALLGGNIPSVEDVVKGKASMPTIADLTGGKVKNDDLIDKSNVELVKEYLPAGIYELVKKGMVLKMGTQVPPDQCNPKVFYEVTERNRSKAVLDKNGVVYYEKVGTKWPGGYPFPWAQTGLEAMANHQYGMVWDSYRIRPLALWFVNPKGEAYKTIYQESLWVKCNGRIIRPPLGAIPGYENIIFRRITAMISPLEVAGLGVYSNRYYDFINNADTGFAYLPAFKRTLRVNTTTWQDNVAGTDFLNGDGGGSGFMEPLVDWNFKLLGKKFILITEAKSPFPYTDEHGAVSKKLKFDGGGQKYPRVGWVICPVDVVEATPRIKHIYGKRVLYISIYPYVTSAATNLAVDIYDGQMKLWKEFLNMRGAIVYIDGDPKKPMTTLYDTAVYDLQTDHTTHAWSSRWDFADVKPQDVNLGLLIKMGR